VATIHDEATLRALKHAVLDALPVWSLPPTTHIELLNVSENVTFFLYDGRNDRRLVLRVHRPGYHTAAEIRSELRWITALREQAVIATPAPVIGVNGDPLYPLHLRSRVISDRIRSFAAYSLSAPTGGRGQGEVGGALESPTSPSRGSSPGQALSAPEGGEEQFGPCRRTEANRPSGTRYAVAFEYITGHEPSRTDDLAHTFRTLGATTARMHLHARAWTRPPGFVRKTSNFRTMLGDRALWGDWRAAPDLDTIGSALLERTVECLRLRLARFGTKPDRFGLIHADLRLTNLLVDRDALHVIDFDDCGFGWFAYDFAASVSFMEDDPAVPALLAAWLDGYRTVAPFAPEDEAEIPAFVMLRRLLLLAWITSHAEAPTAQTLAGTYTSGTLALADDFLRRYG
jgi:Ser/Thr protein kinase RdoA (MazF antagonist)